jgi:hypothetical protein
MRLLLDSETRERERKKEEVLVSKGLRCTDSPHSLNILSSFTISNILHPANGQQMVSNVCAS